VYGPARDKGFGASISELVAINVAPMQWSKGVGSALLSRVIFDLVEKNYSSIYPWVIKDNNRAIKFYKKFGFRGEGVSKFNCLHSKSPIHEERYVKLLCE
jgi:ribosomal protein S18 acetylase RimI-like enzyme